MSNMKKEAAERDLVGFIVAAYALNQETAWEAGRKASLSKGVVSPNPWPVDSLEHSEWSRGFDHGRRYDNQTVSDSETAAVVETRPAYPVEPLNERSFWATANDMQLHHHLSVDQLAGRLGVGVEQVTQNMVAHHFYDGDGIPLGIHVAN
jgi:hypothetical protein